MQPRPRFSSRLGRCVFALMFGATLLATTAAHAGDVKFGKEPLATDDSGKLSAAGKKAATNELSSVPGEEMWTLHLWAKLDNGGPGPLYVEFFGKLPDGKRYLAYRHEHAGYAGEKFVTMEIDLEGSQGFNKGHTYNVELSQLGPKGNNLKLAEGRLTLAYTEAKEEPAEETEGDDADTEEEPADTAEQDAIDTLASGDGGQADDGPPPVDPAQKKKGCSIDGAAYGIPGVLVLFAVGASRSRRHRDPITERTAR